MIGKIIDSFWDPDTKEAYVRKATPYGTFSGFASAEEEDWDVANEWDGYAFAEYKCDLQALHAKTRQESMRLNGMRRVLAHLDKDHWDDTMRNTVTSLEAQVRRDREACRKMREGYIPYTEKVNALRRAVREGRAHIEIGDSEERMVVDGE